jgi:hypothetical protein
VAYVVLPQILQISIVLQERERECPHSHEKVTGCKWSYKYFTINPHFLMIVTKGGTMVHPFLIFTEDQLKKIKAFIHI